MRPLCSLLALAAVGCLPVDSRPPVSIRLEGVHTPTNPSDELEDILRSDTELATLLDEAPRRRLQVLVAVPTETPDGRHTLRRMGFRADAEYFYPASAVKLCAAVAALEKLEELRAEAGQASLGLETPVRFIDGEGPNRRVFETILRRELEKSLVLSDNDSHNRLFEFVGRDELAERMANVGLRSMRIVHRLGEVGPEREPPVIELLSGGRSIGVAQRVGFEIPPATKVGFLVGSSHVDATSRVVPEPMDFSSKNMISLRELQDLLVAVVRPDLSDGPVPHIGKEREELLTLLGTLPSELKPPRVTKPRSRADDATWKPMHGALTRALPHDRIRVLGKGGRAYGFSVENAYAIDETTGRSLFVAATIYANDNDTINDDRYEYASIASPFVMRLGQVLARTLLAGPPLR